MFRASFTKSGGADKCPESLATAARSRKAEGAAQGRQANEELEGDASITGELFICPESLATAARSVYFCWKSTVKWKM
ncbi:hypothetical protein [Bacillus sp. 2205SS5-2]|uniref:hypothetical protein n=1 Tax=Bacillus sp. 2205SS5-2 TaxID=3109031 RepID=UPI00300501AE